MPVLRVVRLVVSGPVDKGDAGASASIGGRGMDAEQWLEQNTFRCAIGRVSPETCKALRERPVFDPERPGAGPYKPAKCMECTEWRKMMMDRSADKRVSQADRTVTKTCRKCGEKKPLEDFYRAKKSPDGRQYICKECKKLSDRASRRRAKEKAKGNGPDAAQTKAASTQRVSTRPEGRPERTDDREPIRCALCRHRLDWYDGEQDVGFVMEHYVLPEGRRICIVCFSRLYGMRGFKED